jgi:hypothetical protein
MAGAREQKCSNLAFQILFCQWFRTGRDGSTRVSQSSFCPWFRPGAESFNMSLPEFLLVTYGLGSFRLWFGAGGRKVESETSGGSFCQWFGPASRDAQHEASRARFCMASLLLILLVLLALLLQVLLDVLLPEWTRGVSDCSRTYDRAGSRGSSTGSIVLHLIEYVI